MTDSHLAAVVDRAERNLPRIVDGVVAAICAEIAVYAKGSGSSWPTSSGRTRTRTSSTPSSRQPRRSGS